MIHVPAEVKAILIWSHKACLASKKMRENKEK